MPGNGCQRRRDESAIIGPTHFYGVVIDGIDAIETETNTDEDEHGPSAFVYAVTVRASRQPRWTPHKRLTG